MLDLGTALAPEKKNEGPLRTIFAGIGSVHEPVRVHRNKVRATSMARQSGINSTRHGKLPTLYKHLPTSKIYGNMFYTCANTVKTYCNFVKSTPTW